MAEQLIWHATNKSKDGKMRHPSDSLAWKHIDHRFPAFASDSRNLRLGLAADGFNPFGDLSATHSCWLVMIVIYNLPPHACMQAKNIILSMLIPGKKQPGKDIDVYLQPLIDDLIELWENGVKVYDSFSKKKFNLKALLMWTINDFLAHGNLSGCTYKGKEACPLCGDNTLSVWLPFSRKTVYMNHRRFLRDNHPFRQKKDMFNGEIERREKPPVMSSAEVFERQSSIRKKDVVSDAARFGAPDEETEFRVFNKRSIFFDLPYWKDLLLRHNIDVMHTEKNVCESIIGTILNIKFKTKDGLNSRNDLKSMGIRPELHPEVINGKTILRAAPYILSHKNKVILYNRMRNMKVPYRYSLDLRKHFSKDGCLGVLKAHDYHVLMQQILPVALRGVLPEGPTREVRLCGPVQYRWMYPFERYIKTFKEYVKNYALPEACIAECYLGMECVRCWILKDQAAEIRYNPRPDKNDGTTPAARPLSKGEQVCMDSEKLKIAHRYVFFNTAEIDPYLTMHMDELKSSVGRSVTNEDHLISIQSETFADWFKKNVYMQMEQGMSLSNTVEWLSKGPLENCVSYKGLLMNGSRCLTKDVQRVTQNSGVSIESKTIVAGRSETTGFYGVLEEILVLDYITLQVPIFKSDSAHTYFGVKLEKGFTLVNLKQHKNQFRNDPFILAS
ncbi:uncharacterized protein LOC113283208 [Papaver somniferum]|uniref:uncharacterized protein LOC113283208 n=1 Tax=Papaver somniferum TaxID=3469 RepID=UPI000E6F9056|nr:uncharacterized protein LOC113283208 [Papaver somniferum]